MSERRLNFCDLPKTSLYIVVNHRGATQKCHWVGTFSFLQNCTQLLQYKGTEAEPPRVLLGCKFPRVPTLFPASKTLLSVLIQKMCVHPRLVKGYLLNISKWRIRIYTTIISIPLGCYLNLYPYVTLNIRRMHTALEFEWRSEYLNLLTSSFLTLVWQQLCYSKWPQNS